MKRILAVLLAVCMLFAMTACSGKFKSVEEFVNSDKFQEELGQTMEEAEGQGISIDILAEGNKMVFQYTLTEQVEVSDLLVETMESSIDAQADTFKNAAKELAEQVDSDETLVVVLRYLNSDGSEILEKEFTAE